MGEHRPLRRFPRARGRLDLYVVIELIMICGRNVKKEVMLAGVLLGLVLGFGTDFVLVAVGA